MKNIVFVFVLVFVAAPLFAQNEIFTVVETYPGFVGGDKELSDFIFKSIHYPKKALNQGVQGKVFVTFVIETDGSVSNATILRGIGAGCDEEAIRVVLSMPKWTPGYQNGTPVRVKYTIPIAFQINRKSN